MEHGFKGFDTDKRIFLNNPYLSASCAKKIDSKLILGITFQDFAFGWEIEAQKLNFLLKFN
ncbi:hypothetical protein EGI26_19230 [Lacihabitans sp. CCS-44]|nr:hypothetical protein [Lacihabitans sp. CCS-44]